MCASIRRIVRFHAHLPRKHDPQLEPVPKVSVLALAAAIGLEPGEEVQWELLERGKLHIRRTHAPDPIGKSSPKSKTPTRS